jgi:hypothetical protein
MTAVPFGGHAGRTDTFRDAHAMIIAALDRDGSAIDAVLGGTPDLRELAIAIAAYAARVSTALSLGDKAAARAMLTASLAAVAAAEAGQGRQP